MFSLCTGTCTSHYVKKINNLIKINPFPPRPTKTSSFVIITTLSNVRRFYSSGQSLALGEKGSTGCPASCPEKSKSIQGISECL